MMIFGYGFAEGWYTGEEELPYTDEEGDNLRETYEYYISSAEFDALEEMIFGDATPQTVSDFTDYAEDTLAEVFLN